MTPAERKAKARVARLLVRRVAYLDQVRTFALEGFEVAPSPAYVVRRVEVAEYVARRMGVPVANRLILALIAVGRRLGWEPVNNGNRRLFRRAKRRGVDAAAALAQSRELRRDARWSGKERAA